MKPEKQLYQWDVNQYLTGINPAAKYVDYTICNDVIRLETDGTRCRIPDEVLQTYGGKTCYERYPDGTYRAYSFTVLYAPKPPDYVYTPEERTTFEALTARVDAAIDEIKRRADFGEFTPKKGVDYFTESEKNEMMQRVSDGAIGEFREVVDSATAGFNKNSSAKTNDYNANAEKKVGVYDSNAAEKLEAYNSNHTEKLTEYNTNAENKKAEFEADIEGHLSEKANVDGYYEEMTVGDAEQLISTQFVEDNKPYLFRPTGGSSDVGNRAYLDKIVGGTVAWNQQLKLDKVNNDNGITASLNNDGSITINGTATSDAYIQIDSRNSFKLNENHKYLYKGCPSGGSRTGYFLGDAWNNMGIDYGSGTIFTATSGIFQPRIVVRKGNTVGNLTFRPALFDITQMFGSTIADYIYSLEQANEGAGVAWFKKLFPNDYYAYNAGELLSVEGLQSHDTVGFNQWDEALENGGLYTETGLPFDGTGWFRTKNFIPIFPSTTYYYKIPTRAKCARLYFYGVDKNFISYIGTSMMMNTTFTTPQNAHYMKFKLSEADYGTTYNHDICVNLSDPSRNGEYEPYEKHSYPLDNSLTLRGMPKLDSFNNLYYDGDEYASDGKVKGKYGVVDLGTLDWKYDTVDAIPKFSSLGISGAIKKVESYTSVGKFICTKYAAGDWITAFGTGTYNLLATNPKGAIAVGDSDYTDTAAFKAAMSGVMLVYELATPITETAEPFQNIQIVDDLGTEEFVSTGIVPVGHNTRYPANLRDKLQHLPSLANTDGTYLIQQSDKQMSLIHMPAVFPETPTEDGTYTLKTVVTGGVATLQWVAE